MDQQEVKFQNFHKEILHEIFDLVSVKDLLSLALTCKNFSSIISNSSILCRKFQVLLTYRRKYRKWIGSRKYQNFKFHLCTQRDVTYFLKIFELHGMNVTSLELLETSFKVETLWILFMLCPNVKYINFKYNYPNRLAEDGAILAHLERLDYEGESICIENFSKCQDLKALSMSGSHSWSESALQRFLESQTKLRNLRLKDFDSRCFIFTSRILSEKIQFQLTTLSLINIGCPLNSRLFKDFLDIHKKTLINLEIGNVPYGILRYFSDFKNIKTLKIISIFERDEINIDNFFLSPMEQVENLIIHNQDVSNYAAKFPNLITLETRGLRMKPMEIRQLKKLQKLTIIESKNISKLSIPSVRELRFVSCQFKGGKVLSSNQNSIETLSIRSCKKVDWLTSFLWQKNLRLKEFEVIETRMTREVYRDVMAMSGRVDKLIVSSNKLMSVMQVFKDRCLNSFKVFVECFYEVEL